MSRRWCRQDIPLMKQNNFNAVRCSHLSEPSAVHARRPLRPVCGG
ncbi:glycoside hydrolase family 2 TIM barrel-domain containing protein [Klebsiella pneumoniae]